MLVLVAVMMAVLFKHTCASLYVNFASALSPDQQTCLLCRYVWTQYSMYSIQHTMPVQFIMFIHQWRNVISIECEQH